MKTMNYESGGFTNTGEQETEVRKWGGRYSGLIGKLGELGTQVRVSRTLEVDQDIAPNNFVRGAVHEFIFPPQEVSVREDNSGVIDSTPGYSLRREDTTYTYDAAAVTGHLEVLYSDSDSRISFSVTDRREGSVLPEGVLAALAQTELA